MTNKTSLVEIINLHPKIDDIKKVIFESLSLNPKKFPAWLLYDENGSKLFDEICKQPEYILTRSEIDLLEKHAKSINKLIGYGTIIEFGAGSSKKIRSILNQDENYSYVAIDISIDHLEKSLKNLKASFPRTNMLGICCDHNKLIELPIHPYIYSNKIGFFPGSSIGNYEHNEAINLLKNFHRLLNGGPLIIGIDHPKAIEKMESAYNDKKGVSKNFAINLLRRFNKEINSNFIIENYNYQAIWEEKYSRIRMEIKSIKDQIINIDNSFWEITKDEEIITEYSVKYSHQNIMELAKESGWLISDYWEDELNKFSIILMKSQH
tara:strand:- start:2037 stop:3002 length:966 start_codon:yes stop_codon:yes gene_type:complete